MKTFLFPILLAVLLVSNAGAQAPATGTPPTATPAAKAKPLASGEQTYVRNALKSLNYQVKLADAGKAIADQNLLRLRDTTAKELGNALQELGKIATAHGEKLPGDVSGAEKVDLDRVNRAKLDKLPKEWAAALAKESKRLDHETDVAGKTAQDADLKMFLTNYGPTIRNVATSSETADKALKAAK